MTERDEIEALERAVEADPGGAQFPVLAEAYRRAGRHDDARRVAVAGLAVRPDDTAGRLALGLALLDLGEVAAARYELERAMGSVVEDPSMQPFPERNLEGAFEDGLRLGDPRAEASSEQLIDDDELEVAFADAESVPDEMLDANRIAAQAIVAGELDAPEGLVLEEQAPTSPVAEENFQIEEAPAFATETMARLLADQGDVRGAETIRERIGVQGDGSAEAEPLAVATDAPIDSAAARHRRILSTLETWLENMQRNPA
ncbi:MAG: hypothetical protein VX246_14035 [Myxococcota bacterium]|nr:hypothetical protein [Myxococcota bacterium]